MGREPEPRVRHHLGSPLVLTEKTRRRGVNVGPSAAARVTAGKRDPAHGRAQKPRHQNTELTDKELTETNIYCNLFLR